MEAVSASLVEAREMRLFEALHQEAATRGYGSVDTSPHEFSPLKKWRNRGRCTACLVHEDHHPTWGWLPARPMYDKQEAIRIG